ncbi:MAG: DUF4173 domain-containing protein [Anaerolineae bacterium]|nr:DUF4173 domain-containing protein [Anaerolineae bacterium]
MTAGSADARLEVPATRPVRAARTALVSAGILGVVADLTLRTAGDGLGWTLWVVALAGTALHVGRRRGIPVSTEPIAWLAVAVTCAAAFAWRDAEALRLANVLGTLVAVSMFGMAASGLPAASVLVARLRDVVATGIYAARDVVAGAILLVARDVDLPALPAFRGGRSWTAVRALLLTLPVALVFVVLLSRADPVFASLFNLQAIDVERLLEHGVVIGAFAWWSAGWMRGALLGTSRRPAPPERLPVRLGLAEVTSLFGAVIALFSVFIALQLRWLFGGADVVLATTGLTVAEYARRGFFELVGVSTLTLGLMLWLDTVTKRQTGGQQTLFRVLSIGMIVLVGIMLWSAHLRLTLYEEAYGFTHLRLYPHVFMFWLAALFGFFLLSLFRLRRNIFALGTVICVIGYLATLNLINPDYTIMQQNIARYQQSRSLDIGYLRYVSADAISALLPFYQQVEDRELRYGLGQWLVGQQQTLDAQRADAAFLSAHVGRDTAWAMLDAARADLPEYDPAYVLPYTYEFEPLR